MYFYALKKVKSKFLTTGFSERESLSYVVAYAVITSLGYYITSGDANLWESLSAIVSTLFAVFGTILLYLANGGAAGRLFIMKYIILGWVLVIRALTILVPAIIAIAALAYALEFSGEETLGPWEFILFALTEIIIYAYMYRHFADLRKSETAAAK